jgi:energy-coupling factor transport system ATP-binding protein
VLKDVSVLIEPGERVAIMGRNGAGKSTLLRHAAGLLEPTRGSIKSSGRVALLLQDPGAYLVRDTVALEAPEDALAAAGLKHLSRRHPRDLSGGERQRLALAVVLGSDGDGDGPHTASRTPAVVCLDEPTRGMDRGAKARLADRLAALPAAVIVATHDAEFAARVADRVILLADGRPIADGSVSQVLCGGWYFATETARIFGGARGLVLPDDGAKALVAARAKQTARASLPAMASGGAAL